MDGLQPTTQSRRQRVDDAQAVLERTHATLATAKARKMRLLSEIEMADQALEGAMKAAAEAEEALGMALSYRDPAPRSAAEEFRPLGESAQVGSAPDGGDLDPVSAPPEQRDPNRPLGINFD